MSSLSSPRRWSLTLLSLAALASASCAFVPADEGPGESVADNHTSFEEFKASLDRDPESGAYVVEGDILIFGDEALEQYYATIEQPGALAVWQPGGVDSRWSDAQKMNLTYCVSSAGANSFGANHATAVAAMGAAAREWMQVADVTFIHLSSHDGNCTSANNDVTFNVKLVSGTPYAASAFYPTQERSLRELNINWTSATNAGAWTLTGILRHELGHAMGFLHEHIRPEAAPIGDCSEDGVTWYGLTPYDSASVMHYTQCPGATNVGDLVLTARDKQGAATLYGRLRGSSQNLARGKPASQSSTDWGGDAARAVDDNIEGHFGYNSVTHTGTDYQPWWQVDLLGLQRVGDVVLFNRTDCCSDRLSNFSVQVSDDGASWETASNYPGTAPTRTVIAVNRTARYVRVQRNGSGVLSLAEVQVIPPTANLAVGRPASQSSTDWGGDAARALDGSPDGNYDHGSITHTGTEYQPYWQVDLQSSSSIGDVVLFNRTDSCCSNRLTNFSVKVSDDGTNWETASNYPGTAPTRTTLALNRTARYVRVQLNGSGVLSLAEAQIFAPN